MVKLFAHRFRCVVTLKDEKERERQRKNVQNEWKVYMKGINLNKPAHLLSFFFREWLAGRWLRRICAFIRRYLGEKCSVRTKLKSSSKFLTKANKPTQNTKCNCILFLTELIQCATKSDEKFFGQIKIKIQLYGANMYTYNARHNNSMVWIWEGYSHWFN